MAGNFDSHLELKIWPFKISPCLYREALHLQCFPPTRYVLNGEYPLGTRTYCVDDLYPICSNRSIGYLLVLYGYTMHPAQLCDGHFFYLVCGLLEKKIQNKR
jgi:hypothetical protein